MAFAGTCFKKQIRQAGGWAFEGGLKPAPTRNQVVGPGFSPDGFDKRQDDSISESKFMGAESMVARMELASWLLP